MFFDFKIKSKETRTKRENIVPDLGILILNNTCLIKKDIIMEILQNIDRTKIYNVGDIDSILKIANKKYVELKSLEKQHTRKHFLKQKKAAINRGVINGGFKIKKTKRKMIL